MLLAAVFVFQLLASSDTELPDAGPMRAGGGRPALPRLVPATGGTVIAARAPFTPVAQPGGPANPLGGTLVVGAIQVGGHPLAVVQRPGGDVAYVRPGGSIADWRLQAVARSEVVLLRGAERVTVPFGGQATPRSDSTGGGSR